MGIILGSALILLCSITLSTTANAESRQFALIGIGFGLIFFVGGVLFGWIRNRAARRYQKAEEQDEPPE
jgi:hypothetical protein